MVEGGGGGTTVSPPPEKPPAADGGAGGSGGGGGGASAPYRRNDDLDVTQVRAGKGLHDNTKADYYVTPKGVAVPASKAEFHDNLSRMTEKNGK